MSLFKTKALILKKTFLSESKEDLFTVFSLDYGKIQVVKKSSKKEKKLDIWYFVDFEIETKLSSDINKIKSIKIYKEFNYVDKSFLIINTYLEIINFVLKNVSIWLPIKTLFETLEFISSFENIDYTKLILSKLKILNILWILNLDNNDLIVSKILNFIDKNHISKIFLLSWIDEKILEKLEKNIKKET